LAGFKKKLYNRKYRVFYFCNRFILRRNFITTAMRKLPYLFQNIVLYFHAPNDSRGISPETEKERNRLSSVEVKEKMVN